MSKYKYYFKKPRTEIAKDVLGWLLTAGAISIAATSPYFVINLIKNYHKWGKYKKRRISDTFYNLKRQGYLCIQKDKHCVHISLTEKGRNAAGIYQIDAMKINKPRRWDKKWRLVLFDIAQLKRLKRDIFREKIRELGFSIFQKSVWVCPYECRDEIDLLRDFFGLTKKEISLVVTEKIDNDSYLRKFFGLV